MNGKLFLVALCFAICLCLPSALAEDGAITVTDMANREITFAQPLTRVVALTPADCEILCAIGARDIIVGRGTYCDYPSEILAIPEVNSGSEVNIEQIIALEPQAVIMNTMDHSIEVSYALEAAGVPVVAIRSEDIEGVYYSIDILGAITGHEAEAEALIADMRAEFAAISAEARGAGKTVYFEVSPLQWGLWTAGGGTFMDEIANICGLENAFADVAGWAEISEEQVIARNPDYIVTITMYYGEGPTPVEEIMARASWADITAVKNGDVLNAESNEISRPGPRLINAAKQLNGFLAE